MRRPWTQEETDLLRELATGPHTYVEIAQRFQGRSHDSINQKMRSMGLQKIDPRDAALAPEPPTRKIREELEQATAELDLYRAVDAAHLRPARWQRKIPRSGHHGTACMVLSDTHYDEVVRPEQIDYFNAYDAKIAELRTRAFFEKGLSLARDYVKGITYDGCVLFLPGDMLSGTIHEELNRTNERPLLESVFYWAERLVPGIRMLADDFGKLTVPCVVGNHPRLSHKPVAKNRAQDNVDWVLYRLLAREFRDDKRVTFMVSDAADLLVPIYNTTYLLTHGDQFRGGTGISAQFSPLMLGQARKTRRQVVLGKPYDWMVMGHWHSYVPDIHGIIASGTLKGYDEYCVVPGTRVLTRDLQWEPVENLRVGDPLWGFSENPTPRISSKPFRVWQKGEVTATGLRKAQTVILHMRSGRTLVSTREHPWLARPRSHDGGTGVLWHRARDVRVGQMMPRFLDPWEKDPSWEAGWLAGMFDGEGSFGWRHGQSNLTLAQNEGHTLQRARDILRRRGYSFGETSNRRKTRHLTIHGDMREKLRLLGEIRADRLIAKVEEGNRLQCPAEFWDVVDAIEDGGERDVVTLGTSTYTYFAEGFAAHNSYVNNFEPEVPKLAFWITTPERGAGFFNPIEPMDRRAEGW